MKYLMAFESTAAAIKSEKTLLKAGVLLKIRPKPNQISSGCGISIHFDDFETVTRLIPEEDYQAIYEIIDKDYLMK